MKQDIKQRYQEDPDSVITEELLDILERTKNPTEKMEAIKMLLSLRDEPTY